MSHRPVMLKEAIENLNIKPQGTYVDLTFGRGGHTKEIMKKLKYGTIIAFDLDDEAISEGHKMTVPTGITFILVKANFKDVHRELSNLGIGHVDGVLLDLGVSSPQFDTPERGFSYRFDAPLDMRMDQNQDLSAYDIVNSYSQKEIFQILKEFGEEKNAKSIARKIVEVRKTKPIETTGELVDIIKESIPTRELYKEKHPAKKSFQALRIATNRELDNLEIALRDCASLLKEDGRLVVITYHSLEDRIVKQYFKSLVSVEGNRLNFPTPFDEKIIIFESLFRKPLLPTESELQTNPRAHSAKLRAIRHK